MPVFLVETLVNESNLIEVDATVELETLASAAIYTTCVST